MGSLVSNVAVIMQLLNEKGGPLPMAQDMIEAAKRIFAKAQNSAKLVGELTVIHQMKEETVQQYSCKKVAIGVLLHDHLESSFTPQGHLELEAMTHSLEKSEHRSLLGRAAVPTCSS